MIITLPVRGVSQKCFPVRWLCLVYFLTPPPPLPSRTTVFPTCLYEDSERTLTSLAICIIQEGWKEELTEKLPAPAGIILTDFFHLIIRSLLLKKAPNVLQNNYSPILLARTGRDFLRPSSDESIRISGVRVHKGMSPTDYRLEEVLPLVHRPPVAIGHN